MRKLSNARISSRGGLSLLEVLICIGCLVLLLVIALPWLLTARGESRETLCLRRAKELTDAAIAYAENHADQMPYLVEETGWPVALTPYMNLPGAAQEGKVLPNEELENLAVPQFVCPDDPRMPEEKGALSYVTNAGYGEFPVDEESGAVSEVGTHSPDLDWNGDGEVTDEDWAIGYATGVGWRPDPREAPAGFRMSLPYIIANDGTKFTLLLAENLNAGHWLSEETMDLAFVTGRERFTFAEEAESRGPLHFTDVDLGPFAVNGNRGTLPGRCPAPSSLHGDYAHVMYCDGHGGPLSAKIDPFAYAGLMTSGGSQFGQAGDELPAPSGENIE